MSTPTANPAVFDPRVPFEEAQRCLAHFLADTHTLARVRAALATLAVCLRGGHKVLAVGNGGSMCDAAHFVEELTGRFRADRVPLAALACNDPGHLTCVANDYGFEFVFERWVRALAKPGDVLLVLSTSGNSQNCVLAARTAREIGVGTIGLLGRSGGLLAGLVDHAILAPGASADRIQEIHKLVLHTFVEGIEHGLGLA